MLFYDTGLWILFGGFVLHRNGYYDSVIVEKLLKFFQNPPFVFHCNLMNLKNDGI